MKKVVFIIYLTVICSYSNIYSQMTNTQFNNKVKIAADVITKILNQQKTEKKTFTGLLNTSFREIFIAKGFGYNGIWFGEMCSDTLFLDSVKAVIENNHLNLYDFNKFSYYRSVVIEGSNHINRDTIKGSERIYFEIGSPIEGWENMDLFYLDNKRLKHIDSLFFEKNYTNTISIPAFVRTTKNDISVKKNFIYIYELIKPQKWKFKKIIEL